MIGLALIMYGREEGADNLVEQMTRDQVTRAHGRRGVAWRSRALLLERQVVVWGGSYVLK